MQTVARFTIFRQSNGKKQNYSLLILLKLYLTVSAVNLIIIIRIQDQKFDLRSRWIHHKTTLDMVIHKYIIIEVSGAKSNILLIHECTWIWFMSIASFSTNSVIWLNDVVDAIHMKNLRVSFTLMKEDRMIAFFIQNL